MSLQTPPKPWPCRVQCRHLWLRHGRPLVLGESLRGAPPHSRRAPSGLGWAHLGRWARRRTAPATVSCRAHGLGASSGHRPARPPHRAAVSCHRPASSALFPAYYGTSLGTRTSVLSRIWRSHVAVHRVPVQFSKRRATPGAPPSCRASVASCPRARGATRGVRAPRGGSACGRHGGCSAGRSFPSAPRTRRRRQRCQVAR